MKPKIKTTCTKLQLHLLSFCLLCLSGKTRCDGNGPAVIKVEQGSDAVLPCSLSSKEDIESYWFDWNKAAQKDGRQKKVFYYDAGVTYDSGRAGQSEEFKGRVSHFPEELKHGNASIIIRNTMVTDSGNYTCDFPRLQPPQTFHIELVVDCVLKDRSDENIPEPVVVTVEEGRDAFLPCSLSTKENIEQGYFDWNKVAQNNEEQKEVFQYLKGRHSNTGFGSQDGGFKDRVSHFQEELTHGNASIIIRNTKMADSGDYTCDFLQPRQTFYIKLVVEPVVVTVKEDRDALLPCSLSTKKNIEQGYFDWNKVAQNSEKRKEVFQYDKGRHSNTGYGSQDGGFKDRVFHFQEELTHGNASIIIRNTNKADNGDYTCTFTEPRQTFHIKLVVAKKPFITALEQTKDWSRLQCEVRGASSKPKVEWKDSSGNKLPAEEPQVTYRGGSYDIILQTNVTKTDYYHCVVTQEDISHQTEATIHVYIGEPTVFKVHEGNYIILPCSLSTKKNIESEMFEWKKDGLKEVFFHGGSHYNSNRPGQSEEFKGRVFHFPEELKHGDASITIRNTKMSDSGDYTCDFPRLQPRQISHIKLVVVKTGNSGSGANSSGSTPGWVIAVLCIISFILFVVAVGVVVLAVLVATGRITLKYNKGSPADHKEGSVVPLKSQPSRSEEAPDPET